MNYYYGNERVYDDEPKKKNKGCTVSIIIILILIFIIPLGTLIFMAVSTPNQLGFGRDKILDLSGTKMSFDEAGLGDKSLLYLSRMIIAFTKNADRASIVDNAFTQDDFDSAEKKLSYTENPLKLKSTGSVTLSDRELASALDAVSDKILQGTGYADNFDLRVEQVTITVSGSAKKINVVLYADIGDIIEKFKSTLPVKIDITSQIYISQTMTLVDTSDGLELDISDFSINGLDKEASIAIVKLIEGGSLMTLNVALRDFLLKNFTSLNIGFDNFYNGEIRMN